MNKKKEFKNLLFMKKAKEKNRIRNKHEKERSTFGEKSLG